MLLNMRRDWRLVAYLDHVDISTQLLFQIKDQLAQIEECAPGLEVDEEVDIAIGTRIAPDDRPEHPDVTRATPCSDPKDIVAVRPHVVQCWRPIQP